ncbi:MAG: hypothetical protein GWP08_14455 [Nitrospiraceae bacterium]|nr:hypothetical protein [Nitrospiraceae bacterium]
MFLTGLVIRNRMKGPHLAACAALCGAIIGVGIGFRVDVLIAMPPFLAALFLLAPGKLRKTFAARTIAATAFCAVFLVTAWPILTQLGEGGNKSHPVLLGFMAPYSQRLGVGGTVYELGHKYADIEPLTIVNAYGRYRDAEAAPIMYESPVYEGLAGEYTRAFVRVFPADVAIRAYAAILRILDELHAGPDHLAPPGITNAFVIALYRLRLFAEQHALTHVRYVAIVALGLLAARSLRLSFATLALLAYFAGYSAVQFGTRNCFHLEVIRLWVVGFAASAVLSQLVARTAPGRVSLRELLHEAKAARFPAARRIAIFVITTTLAAALPLWGLRRYQNAQVSGLLRGYIEASRTPVAYRKTALGDEHILLQGGGVGAADVPWRSDEPYFESQFLLAEFTPAANDRTMTIRYRSDCFETDLTYDATIPAHPDGVTRVFFPVYAGHWLDYAPQWTLFEGIELSESGLTSLSGLYRLQPPTDSPLILHAVLPPGWESMDHFQRLTR